ncbi:SWIM zinc finger domain-containing protein [Proteiniclasticum sp. C24MP]|uniref:SWIM zinc finger family protein n=1 Tax=Proteiniclasticum sp. C24MP TaxID=3374101 RepID=UPI00375517EF
MMEYRWQILFPDHILERGLDYFDKGHVGKLTMEENSLYATVRGTKVYGVGIEFGENIVKEVHCSCPYAEERHICKHIAAVLYAFEGDEKAQEKMKQYWIQNSPERLVMDAEEKVVREFIIRALHEDERLLRRFKAYLKPESVKKEAARTRSRFEKHIKAYLSDRGTIRYYVMEEFLDGLSDLFTEEAKLLIQGRYYAEVLQLFRHLIDTVGAVEMDDSGGSMGLLLEDCAELCMQSLSDVTVSAKKTMFSWIIRKLNEVSDEYMKEMLEHLLLNEFREPEFLPLKLHYVEERVHKHERKGRQRYNDPVLGYWVLQYVEILRQMDTEDERLKKIIKDYWYVYEVRKQWVHRCIESEKYEEAISILKDSIGLESLVYRSDFEMKVMLKDLYLWTENMRGYAEVLTDLVIQDFWGDLDYYRELKSLFGEKKWQKKRDEILKHLSQMRYVDRIYKEEGLYDRLLDFVMNSSGIEELERYDEDLRERYPKEILEKYTHEVNLLAMKRGGRSHYEYLITILDKMKELPDGELWIRKLTDSWKAAFPGRKVMLAEINHYIENQLKK